MNIKDIEQNKELIKIAKRSYAVLNKIGKKYPSLKYSELIKDLKTIIKKHNSIGELR